MSSGLGPDAAAEVDADLARLIDPLVQARVAANADGQCEEGIEQCGLFDLVVKPEGCAKYLCAVVTVSEVGIGAATGNEELYTRVYEPTTGREVGLSEAYGGSPDDAILAAAHRWQDEQGFSRADWVVDPTSISGWIPEADGLHVWFAKYTIGPGSEGVVELTVPYPGDESSDPAPVVGGVDEAANWLCSTVDVTGLPVLRKGSDDAYAVSVLQQLLVYLGYPPNGMPVDGQFGSKTAAAVRQWQEDRGLVVDGVVGPQSWADLQIPCEAAESDAGGNTSGDGVATAAPEQQAPQQQMPQPPAVKPSAVVPDVVGMPAATAQAILQSAGFRMSPQAPMGSSAYIKSQAPPGGSRMAAGSTVSVFFGF